MNHIQMNYGYPINSVPVYATYNNAGHHTFAQISPNSQIRVCPQPVMQPTMGYYAQNISPNSQIRVCPQPAMQPTMGYYAQNISPNSHIPLLPQTAMQPNMGYYAQYSFANNVAQQFPVVYQNTNEQMSTVINVPTQQQIPIFKLCGFVEDIQQIDFQQRHLLFSNGHDAQVCGIIESMDYQTESVPSCQSNCQSFTTPNSTNELVEHVPADHPSYKFGPPLNLSLSGDEYFLPLEVYNGASQYYVEKMWRERNDLIAAGNLAMANENRENTMPIQQNFENVMEEKNEDDISDSVSTTTNYEKRPDSIGLNCDQEASGNIERGQIIDTSENVAKNENNCPTICDSIVFDGVQETLDEDDQKKIDFMESEAVQETFVEDVQKKINSILMEADEETLDEDVQKKIDAILLQAVQETMAEDVENKIDSIEFDGVPETLDEEFLMEIDAILLAAVQDSLKKEFQKKKEENTVVQFDSRVKLSAVKFSQIKIENISEPEETNEHNSSVEDVAVVDVKTSSVNSSKSLVRDSDCKNNDNDAESELRKEMKRMKNRENRRRKADAHKQKIKEEKRKIKLLSRHSKDFKKFAEKVKITDYLPEVVQDLLQKSQATPKNRKHGQIYAICNVAIRNMVHTNIIERKLISEKNEHLELQFAAFYEITKQCALFGNVENIPAIRPDQLKLIKIIDFSNTLTKMKIKLEVLREKNAENHVDLLNEQIPFAELFMDIFKHLGYLLRIKDEDEKAEISEHFQRIIETKIKEWEGNVLIYDVSEIRSTNPPSTPTLKKQLLIKLINSFHTHHCFARNHFFSNNH